jgi:hypothetical protein
VADGAAQEAPLDREPDLEILRVDDRRSTLRHGVGLALGLGGQQHAGVDVLGTREDLGRRTGLDDQPLLHHRDPVGDPPHDVEVVGDEEHRHAAGRAGSREELRIWAWIVTSSAVVGSSAIRIFGSLASAIAIITRCR